MRKFYSASCLVLFVLALFVLSACEKDTVPQTQDIWKFDVAMSGAQEFPTNTSTGTGRATGTFDAGSNLLTYSVTWSGLTGTATLGHFHSPALPGANAGVLVTFLLQNNGTSGSTSGSATISDAQEADLMAGKFYANIHTATYGGGEIRGQVTLTR